MAEPRPAGDFLRDILRQAGRQQHRRAYNEALDRVLSPTLRPHCQVVGCTRGKLVLDDKPCAKAKVDVAVGPIFELSLRLSDLGLKPEDPAHFAIEAFAKKHSLDRAPREGSIELRCPTEDFELVMWQA